MKSLQDKDIDLIMCHIGQSTKKMAKVFREHLQASSTARGWVRTLTEVDLGEGSRAVTDAGSTLTASVTNYHIVFCLDESSSMGGGPWQDLMVAYRSYLDRRQVDQGVCDLVSVVKFSSSATLAVNCCSITTAPRTLSMSGGGTNFSAALRSALPQLRKTKSTHQPLLLFMSDGLGGSATQDCQQIAREIPNVQAHFIGFGSGSGMSELRSMANMFGNGKAFECRDGKALQAKFTEIARGCHVTEKLMAEVGKKISDEMCTKLRLEYL